MKKKQLTFFLSLCIALSAIAVFLVKVSENNNAFAASGDTEIIGSWYQFSDGKVYEMYQFKKDGTFIYYDNYEIENQGHYQFDSKNESIMIINNNYYCSVCENGLIIENVSYPGILEVYIRA